MVKKPKDIPSCEMPEVTMGRPQLRSSPLAQRIWQDDDLAVAGGFAQRVQHLVASLL